MLRNAGCHFLLCLVLSSLFDHSLHLNVFMPNRLKTYQHRRKLDVLSLCLAAFALLLRQQEEVRPKSSSNEVLSDTHCISLLFNDKQERFLTLVSIHGPNH